MVLRAGPTFSRSLDWWVRLCVNGREKWFPVDSKSQAKTLYVRLRSEARKNWYFPEKYAVSKELTLRAWITRYS